MIEKSLKIRAHEKLVQAIPLPMTGDTSTRLKHIFETGREDLSLAKICEAHWDAIGILHEANRVPKPAQTYGVWASEIPGSALQLSKVDKNLFFLCGTKMFSSGAGIIDNTIITAKLDGNDVMVELNLKEHPNAFEIVTDEWFTMAFCETNTSTVIFRNFPVEASDIFGAENWYVNRRGFWIGAVGPAACWGGGAAGLLDYAMTRKRHDPHTLAHLAAISANVFAIESLLASCGNAFDNHQPSIANLQIIALKARHLVEMHCTDIIRRFARAYGPFPMACDKNVSRRYQELDLYLRQNHAERDLESLGRTMLNL